MEFFQTLQLTPVMWAVLAVAVLMLVWLFWWLIKDFMKMSRCPKCGSLHREKTLTTTTTEYSDNMWGVYFGRHRDTRTVLAIRCLDCKRVSLDFDDT